MTMNPSAAGSGTAVITRISSRRDVVEKSKRTVREICRERDDVVHCDTLGLEAGSFHSAKIVELIRRRESVEQRVGGVERARLDEDPQDVAIELTEPPEAPEPDSGSKWNR